MTVKEKSYKELKTEQTRGKKRFLERVVQDKEAAVQVEEFLEGKDEVEYETSPTKRPTY